MVNGHGNGEEGAFEEDFGPNWERNVGDYAKTFAKDGVDGIEGI